MTDGGGNQVGVADPMLAPFADNRPATVDVATADATAVAPDHYS